MTKTSWSIEPIVTWLFREGRLTADADMFTERLGRALVEAGAPVWRLRLNCRTIHPRIAAWSVVWSTDMEAARERTAGHGYLSNDTYIGSPMAHVLETGTAFRRKMDALDESSDHRLLFDLRAEGATDYVALPATFSDGSTLSFIFVSASAGGFNDQDITKLTGLTDYIAPIFEIYMVRRMSRAFLETYVGPRTGERILSGQIKRGDGETIKAAIWFSDLREFTPLTETLPAGALLELLNSYFEAVTAAVTARGGEVLRFIGDAMLIVFPIGGEVSMQAACQSAVDAAQDAFDGIAALNVRRTRAGNPEIAFGVGLHVGEVIYGNVGAPDRLDFTVMGPAVNRAARLEGLTKSLGHPLLLSGALAKAITYETTSCGAHALKGVSDPMEVFALSP